MSFLHFISLLALLLGVFILTGLGTSKLWLASAHRYTRLTGKAPIDYWPMLCLFILSLLLPVAATIAVFWVFPSNVAQFEHLTKKLFGYSVSRLTLEFPPLTPEEQGRVIERLDFLLASSFKVIRYRVANLRSHTSHVEKDTIPAYFQWQDGQRLILVTGQAFPPEKARWLRQILTLGTQGEQALPAEADVTIGGEEAGTLRLSLRQASLDMMALGSLADRLTGKADFACVLAIPLQRMSPLFFGLAANVIEVTSLGKDVSENVTARFPNDVKLTRKSYPVVGADAGGENRRPRLLLFLSRHAAKDFRWPSDRVEQCGPKTMPLLEPAWQVLLARQALAEMSPSEIRGFVFEEKATFSPWYAKGAWQPVFPKPDA